jgi:hypothetical protein
MKTQILKSDFGSQVDERQHISETDERDLMNFFRKILPLLEQELESNSTSNAFNGYTVMRDDISEGAVLWKVLTVDLEKHKVCNIHIHSAMFIILSRIYIFHISTY